MSITWAGTQTDETNPITRPKPVPDIIRCHDCGNDWCSGECCIVVSEELTELLEDRRRGTTTGYASFGYGDGRFDVVVRNGASHIRVA